jgi:hypothetical protein
MSELDPIVGNWYKNLESAGEFEVVAVDEEGQTVEIQYFDGEIEEIDMDSWYELALEPVEPPEDWSGAFDELEVDDLGYDNSAGVEKKSNPLQDLC